METCSPRGVHLGLSELADSIVVSWRMDSRECGATVHFRRIGTSDSTLTESIRQSLPLWKDATHITSNSVDDSGSVEGVMKSYSRDDLCGAQSKDGWPVGDTEILTFHAIIRGLSFDSDYEYWIGDNLLTKSTFRVSHVVFVPLRRFSRIVPLSRTEPLLHQHPFPTECRCCPPFQRHRC